MLHHFWEHHNDASTSFIGFLQKHYAEENAHPSANNEHEKLPFKSHGIGFLQTVLVFHAPIGFEFKTLRPISTKENIFYSEAFYSSSIRSKIWQPPKSC